MLRTIVSFQRDSGQLVIVIPIVIALFLGGSLLWKYLSISQTQYASIKARMDIEKNSTSAASKIQKILAGSMSAATTACQSRFSPFRNFNATTSSMDLDLAEAISCGLISSADSTELDQFKIHLTRIGAPDISSLSSKIKLIIEARSKQKQRVKIAQTSLTRSYSMRVASLGNFNVILTDPAPLSALLEAGNGSLTIYGNTYYAGSTTPIPLSNIAPLPDSATEPTVILKKIFYLRPNQIRYETESGLLDIPQFKRIFQDGIETGVLSFANPLPFEDQTSDPGPWTQKMDYQYLYSASGYPLPRLPNDTAISNTIDNPPKKYEEDKASFTSTGNVIDGFKIQKTCKKRNNQNQNHNQHRSRNNMLPRRPCNLFGLNLSLPNIALKATY